MGASLPSRSPNPRRCCWPAWPRRGSLRVGGKARRFAASAAVLLTACTAALGCEPAASPIFACDAAKGRKFIELCATSSGASGPGTLQYRFGSLDGEGREKAVELEFPRSLDASHRKFFGATYTHQGVYTQSIRFQSGGYGYTVFTRSKGNQLVGAGVDVRNTATGKTLSVDCSERPRFYIFELQGLVPCDPDTPVGNACIQ